MPTLQGYKGGDLWGIMENLDYIQDLEINAIYFTPIFQSACNHRYPKYRTKNSETGEIVEVEHLNKMGATLLVRRGVELREVLEEVEG
ncbi:Neopullulanase [Richelia intracellularis]|nr:Neopullulanase [Richelia intracellularis]